MPGAGKSTVGPILAQSLGLPFQDSDALIEEETRLDIAEIFRRHGEKWFRQAEARVIADLLSGPPAVIAVGGGAFLTPRTRAFTLRRSSVFWLDADLVVLHGRIHNGGRPLLEGKSPDHLAIMKRERDPFYALAHARIDANAAPARVAQAILASPPASIWG
jgi:shikimate kinase